MIDQLGGKRFDRVLLLDILEHLKNASLLLEQCKQVVKPDGYLVVSLPNIANISVRLELLFGRFNYTERGILDKTHLRFFTRKTARRFLENAGYRIVQEKETVIPLELVLGLSGNNWLMKVLNRMLAMLTALLPGLFGYQIMFLAQPPRL